MNLPILDNDRDIERIIKKAKATFGFIPAHELGSKNEIGDTFLLFAKEKMLNYKLIEKSSESDSYYLTERGWQFESISKEDEIAANNRKKLSVDLRNAERVYSSYKITRAFAWIGAISGILLLALRVIEWYNKTHQ